MTGRDFVWLVTDDIVGLYENLSFEGSFPSYYQGLLGIVPTYGKNTATYNRYSVHRENIMCI